MKTIFLLAIVVVALIVLFASIADGAPSSGAMSGTSALSFVPPMPSVPVPVVKRPKPLLSPSHAAAPKAKKMVKASRLVGGSENPPRPMTMEMVRVVSPYGAYRAKAGATQPANHALSLEMSAILGEWVPLAYFGPQPVEQDSFAELYTNSEMIFVRAELIPISPISRQTQTGWMPASLVPVDGAIGKTYKNPNLPGARAWSVKK